MAVLLGTGSLVVHETRYLLASGHGTGHGASGHGYLTVLIPLVGLLLAAAAAHFTWSLATRRPELLKLGRRRTAGFFASALLMIYVGQESVEGILAPGHPDGLAGVFGGGGWVAVPLCAIVGAALSLMTRGLRRIADAALALRPTRLLPCAEDAPVRPEARRRLGPPGTPLALLGAERAPPLLVI